MVRTIWKIIFFHSHCLFLFNLKTKFQNFYIFCGFNKKILYFQMLLTGVGHKNLPFYPLIIPNFFHSLAKSVSEFKTRDYQNVVLVLINLYGLQLWLQCWLFKFFLKLPFLLFAWDDSKYHTSMKLQNLLYLLQVDTSYSRWKIWVLSSETFSNSNKYPRLILTYLSLLWEQSGLLGQSTREVH